MPADPRGELDVRTERAATQFSEFLRVTLERLASLAFGVASVAFVIAAATYLTGLWTLDGSHRTTWVVLGAVICGIPVVTGINAWRLVRTTARRAPQLPGDVRELLAESKPAVAMVIDHDSGQPLATTARSLGDLRTLLAAAPRKYASLRAAVRAATRVPGLVALTVLGALIIGMLGTILLIAGLVG
jgi:hypothetical protein